MTILLWLLLVPVGLVVGFLVLLFVVSLAEKTPIVQFQDGEIEVNPPELPPYLNAMNEAASRNGFSYGGTFRHVKYPLLATFWYSPDRRTIVQAVGGTVANVRHRSTTMTSDVGDDRLIMTRDEFTVADMSGMVSMEFVVNASFEELWAAHEQRLQVVGAPALPFDNPSAMLAMREIDRRRAETMAARGMARWTDASRSAFRYTVAAALRISTKGFFGQLAKDRAQRERISNPRPGDRREPFGFPVRPMVPTDPAALPPVLTPRPTRSDREFLH